MDSFIGKYERVSADKYDDFLKTLDVNFLLRKAATASTPVMEVSREGDVWNIKTSTTLKSMELKFEVILLRWVNLAFLFRCHIGRVFYIQYFHNSKLGLLHLLICSFIFQIKLQIRSLQFELDRQFLLKFSPNFSLIIYETSKSPLTWHTLYYGSF